MKKRGSEREEEREKTKEIIRRGDSYRGRRERKGRRRRQYYQGKFVYE
jgi:hypothetical protein